jgi:hypothetical protein
VNRPTIRALGAISSILICLLGAARVACAQVDPWEFEVYPYATEGRGVAEIETDNAVIASGHGHGGEGTAAGDFRSQGMWYNQYELTYGLTDRIEASAYLLMAQPSGHGFWYAGSEYRLRGRLFDPGVLPIDLGWYAELEWHKTPQFDNADIEMELRPILEEDIGRFSFIANPIFEKVLKGVGVNQGFEFGYSAGTYYRWTRYLSPGIEFYGGAGLIDGTDPLSSQQHYIVPVIWGELPHGIEYNLGPGIGVTRGSDRVLVKFNFELEQFIGALFGPSSEQGWFF